jgi:hypothetical protein
MALFPDLIGEQFDMTPYIRVDETPVAESEVALYRQFIRPRWMFDLAWSTLNDTDAQSIADHVNTQAGGGIAFDWYTWFTNLHWIWVPIATGNGVTTLFVIPGTQTSDHEFFTGAGTPATGSISAGTGPNGEDRVTFSVAPASGVAIWANFRGRQKFNVRYERDEQPPQRDADSGTWSFKTRLVQTK